MAVPTPFGDGVVSGACDLRPVRDQRFYHVCITSGTLFPPVPILPFSVWHISASAIRIRESIGWYSRTVTLGGRGLRCSDSGSSRRSACFVLESCGKHGVPALSAAFVGVQTVPCAVTDISPLCLGILRVPARRFDHIRLIRTDFFEIFHRLVTDRASAASGPRQSVNFICVRVPDAVILLVPRFVSVGNIV